MIEKFLLYWNIRKDWKLAHRRDIQMSNKNLYYTNSDLDKPEKNLTFWGNCFESFCWDIIDTFFHVFQIQYGYATEIFLLIRMRSSVSHFIFIRWPKTMTNRDDECYLCIFVTLFFPYWTMDFSIRPWQKQNQGQESKG